MKFYKGSNYWSMIITFVHFMQMISNLTMGRDIDLRFSEQLVTNNTYTGH